jgi:hypothetical protein
MHDKAATDIREDKEDVDEEETLVHRISNWFKKLTK